MVTANATTQRVWVDLSASLDVTPGGAPDAVPVGSMDVVTVAERAVAVTFTYDDTYLSRPEAFAVSPELPLQASPTILAAMPGAFADASADSWGQKLIRRQLRTQGVTELSEVDTLLGVSDEARPGALRFRRHEGYLAAQDDAVPVHLEAEQLRATARRVAAGVQEADAAIDELLDAGTAMLGGARPKAFVRRKGRALLAKFPAPDDEHDAIRWEAVSLTLAHAAGLPTPRLRTLAIGDRAVLLVDRFDRVLWKDASLPEERIPYWSGRTATGPGASGSKDYLDLARVIRDQEAAGLEQAEKVGKQALVRLRAHRRAQERELWRRAAFAVAVHCTDDHLRNVGFLRRDGLWGLCPVFDVEPDPLQGRPRATAIAGAVDRAEEPEALVRLAGELGLKKRTWQAALAQVLSAVQAWPEVARHRGLPEAEFETMDAAIGHRHDALAELLA